MTGHVIRSHDGRHHTKHGPFPAFAVSFDIMADKITKIRQEVAEETQRALVAVALQAYEEAGLSGLCAEGRWEVALGAMRSYDVRKLTQ